MKLIYNIKLKGLKNHYKKQGLKEYNIKIGDKVNIGNYWLSGIVTEIGKDYIEILMGKKIKYKQKKTLNGLFTPYNEFKTLQDSYIIKDKKDLNYGKDFRYIPLENI